MSNRFGRQMSRPNAVMLDAVFTILFLHAAYCWIMGSSIQKGCTETEAIGYSVALLGMGALVIRTLRKGQR